MTYGLSALDSSALDASVFFFPPNMVRDLLLQPVSAFKQQRRRRVLYLVLDIMLKRIPSKAGHLLASSAVHLVQSFRCHASGFEFKHRPWILQRWLTHIDGVDPSPGAVFLPSWYSSHVAPPNCGSIPESQTYEFHRLRYIIGRKCASSPFSQRRSHSLLSPPFRTSFLSFTTTERPLLLWNICIP